MNTIRVGSQVRFTSPEDGQQYVGLVSKISSSTSVATITYDHSYGSELVQQRECLQLMKLELV